MLQQSDPSRETKMEGVLSFPFVINMQAMINGKLS